MMPLNITAVTTGIALAVLVLDHLLLLPRELGIYRWKSRRPASSTTLLSFLLLRYSGLLASISFLLFVTLRTNHCQGIIIANQIGILLVVASSGCIFYSAAMNKWDGNRLVAGLIGALYTTMVACSCVTAIQVHPVFIDDPLLVGCALKPLNTLSALGYASSFAFNAAIVVSLFVKRDNTLPYPAAPYSIKNTIACVGIATVADLFFCITHAMGSTPTLELVKTVSHPFWAVILVITGVRVFMRQASSDSFRLGLPFYARGNDRPQSLNSLSVLNVGRQTPTILITPATAGAREVPMKAYVAGVQPHTRPDTPFSSYDYDPDSDENPDKDGKAAYITRETVVTIN